MELIYLAIVAFAAAFFGGLLGVFVGRRWVVRAAASARKSSVVLSATSQVPGPQILHTIKMRARRVIPKSAPLLDELPRYSISFLGGPLDGQEHALAHLPPAIRVAAGRSDLDPGLGGDRKGKEFMYWLRDTSPGTAAPQFVYDCTRTAKT